MEQVRIIDLRCSNIARNFALLIISVSLFIQLRFTSLKFSPTTDWIVGGIRGTIQQRSSNSLFCRRPLRAFLPWAGVSTLWCCPSSISSADHGVAYPARCPEGWFWRGCCGVWHANHFAGDSDAIGTGCLSPKPTIQWRSLAVSLQSPTIGNCGRRNFVFDLKVGEVDDEYD